MIRTTAQGLIVESATTIVEFKQDRIISIRDARSGEEFLDPALQENVPGFELLHQNGQVSPLGVHPQAHQVHYTLLTERIAEMVVNDWECDVSTRITIDAPTGDILIEPSAWTMQGGIAGLGLNIPGIRKDLQLVAPFQQGVRLPMDHPQMRGKYAQWPSDWEAGFLIFESGPSGFTVQTWDNHFLFKGVRIGREANSQVAQFVTLAPGPLEQNRCVGNLCWRISAYQGDWTAPVKRYRDWYWQAYHLEEAAKMRPAWLEDIRLAVSW